MNASATTPSKTPHYLHWFRRDLRTHDNTAFAHAINQLHDKTDKDKACVSAVFVVTPEQWAEHDMSAVQLDFILRTVTKLQKKLYDKLGVRLYVLSATDFTDGNDQLLKFCKEQQVTQITVNIEYEVNEAARDDDLKQRLDDENIDLSLHHDQCIMPPKTVKTGSDTMYKVFTPFYKNWQSQLDVSPPQLHEIDVSTTQKQADDDWLKTAQSTLKQLHQDVLTNYLHYDKQHHKDAIAYCQEHRIAGEDDAKKQLKAFIKDDIGRYDTTRDRPALHATSQLSAYLTIGAISPRYCYIKAKAALKAQSDKSEDINRWISELAWRDFYRHVMVDRSDIVKGSAYNTDADKQVSWSYDKKHFKAWCDGKTGVPLVDAAMRCLNATGFMHNRLRMVTAMFLTKDLFIDWRWGEQYFMRCLIDGDFASNNGGWQWSASVGTDAAPYFRIMNPFSQSKTHDKQGEFIKTWLPELQDVPTGVLHSESKLNKAFGDQGEFSNVDYPVPMVKHKEARRLAIAEFKKE